MQSITTTIAAKKFEQLMATNHYLSYSSSSSSSITVMHSLIYKLLYQNATRFQKRIWKPPRKRKHFKNNIHIIIKNTIFYLKEQHKILTITIYFAKNRTIRAKKGKPHFQIPREFKRFPLLKDPKEKLKKEKQVETLNKTKTNNLFCWIKKKEKQHNHST